MMRSLTTTFVLLFLLLAQSQAQITVNSSDMAGVGDLVLQAGDSTVAFGPAPGGMGSQTWDLSALAAHDTTAMEFIDPSGTPHASDFPNATMAIREVSPNGDTAHIYLEKSTSVLQVLGIAGTEIPVALQLDPPQRILSFPANYNNTDSSQSMFDVTMDGSSFGADSVRLKNVTTKYDTISAYGSVTTPSGTYDVLRNSVTEYSVDSTWAKAFGAWGFIEESRDTSYYHDFWSDHASAKFPVATMNMDSTNSQVTDIDWLLGLSPASVSKEDPVQRSVLLYPNPTRGKLRVEMEGVSNGIVEVMDLQGRTVQTETFQSERIILDTGDQPKGLYLLQVMNDKGKTVYRGRFEIE